MGIIGLKKDQIEKAESPGWLSPHLGWVQPWYLRPSPRRESRRIETGIAHVGSEDVIGETLEADNTWRGAIHLVSVDDSEIS